MAARRRCDRRCASPDRERRQPPSSAARATCKPVPEVQSESTGGRSRADGYSCQTLLSFLFAARSLRRLRSDVFGDPSVDARRTIDRPATPQIESGWRASTKRGRIAVTLRTFWVRSRDLPTTRPDFIASADRKGGGSHV